jgi:hypothetical protein
MRLLRARAPKGRAWSDQAPVQRPAARSARACDVSSHGTGRLATWAPPNTLNGASWSSFVEPSSRNPAGRAGRPATGALRASGGVE